MHEIRGGVLFKNLWRDTDQRLIELCRKGQSAAWNCLVQRYKNLIYHFPNDAGLSTEDCDEVFQDTFLALHNNLEKLSEIEELGRWVATVAKRNTWKCLHRRRRRPEDAVPEPYEVEDPSHMPQKHLELKLQQTTVRRAMSMLDERCRKLLFLLFYKYDSAEYDRISKEAGIARGSIGPVRHRCLAKFREKLEKLGIHQKNVSKWLE